MDHDDPLDNDDDDLLEDDVDDLVLSLANEEIDFTEKSYDAYESTNNEKIGTYHGTSPFNPAKKAFIKIIQNYRDADKILPEIIYIRVENNETKAYYRCTREANNESLTLANGDKIEFTHRNKVYRIREDELSSKG